MELNIFVAIFAGVVSFLSPCILPIIPGFLAYVAGTGNEGGEAPSKKQIFISSVFFVLGFSVVFALLGVILANVIGSAAYDIQRGLSYVGGAVIVFFGMFLLGFIKPKFLQQNHTIAVKKKFKSKHVTSFVFGSAFAVGWTPCVGAALGAILTLAATNPASAFTLLMSYALGLGIPFLILGAMTSQATAWIAKSQKLFKVLNVVFGVLLIALGVLVFTQSLNLIASFPFLNKLVI
jgi:cytochrome c-type biogenesis protein